MDHPGQGGKTKSDSRRAGERGKGRIRLVTGRTFPFTLSLILLLALALRLYRLDAQSLWYDEGWSIHLAQGSLGEALTQIGSTGHTHPPGYYLLLWAWVRLWGDSIPAVRGLSVLFGLVGVWLIYRLGQALFDRTTGWVAAGLLAISPAHITYSQETRMYALLACCFAALLLLYDRYIRQRAGWGIRHWVALVILEIIAIYTHYFAFFILFSLAAWLLIALALQARRDGFRPYRAARPLWSWVLSQLTVALAFLPWMGVALARTATHAPEGTMTPGPLAFLAQVWAFLMGGHIALYGREPVFALLSQVCLLILLLLAMILWWSRKPMRYKLAYLLFQILVPLAAVYLLARFRPGFHPRYVLMLLIPSLTLVAYVMVTLARGVGITDSPAPRWRVRALSRIVAVLLALLWLLTTGLAAQALLTDAYYARDNARGTAAYLRARLGPEAAVISDVDDWALAYYLAGPLSSPLDTRYGGGTRAETQSPRIFFLHADQPVTALTAQVNQVLLGRSQVALVKWYQGETDKRGILPYLLERTGTLVETRALSAYNVQVYAVDQGPPALSERNVNVDFGPLRLLDATVEIEAPADEAVTVAVTWRKQNETPRDYKTSLTLVDRDGRRVASVDSPIYDLSGLPTSRWALAQEVNSCYVLTPGAAVAPASYSVYIGVYDESDPAGLDVLDEAGARKGKRYKLEVVELDQGRRRTHKVLDREKLGLRPLPNPVSLADGLELRAFTPLQGVIRSGESLTVLLEWHSTAGDLPDYRPTMRLLRGAQVLAAARAAPAYDGYPTSRWQADETVLDWRDLAIPQDTSSGPAELQVTLWGEPVVSLGQVQIDALQHSFSPPLRQVEMAVPLGDIAELVGYDLGATEIAAGQPLSLTLHWRAVGRSPLGYVVFTHLLNAEGKVIAQHDGPPAEGQRPTNGWLGGEFVADQHILRWVEGDATARAYRGSATIEVGLYDPASGQRLVTPEGDSRLLLPSGIMIR